MMVSFFAVSFGTSVFAPLLASFADRVPGIFFGLPLLALASLIFAATHHEDPAAIGMATIHWTVWLGGILGVVLAAVLLLGSIS
ncbi:MAG: hypothetical protein WD072_13350 [Pirellulales bacterium]